MRIGTDYYWDLIKNNWDIEFIDFSLQICNIEIFGIWINILDKCGHFGILGFWIEWGV